MNNKKDILDELNKYRSELQQLKSKKLDKNYNKEKIIELEKIINKLKEELK